MRLCCSEVEAWCRRDASVRSRPYLLQFCATQLEVQLESSYAIGLPDQKWTFFEPLLSTPFSYYQAPTSKRNFNVASSFG